VLWLLLHEMYIFFPQIGWGLAVNFCFWNEGSIIGLTEQGNWE